MLEKTISNVTRAHIPERCCQLFGECSECILWQGSWARFLKVPISLRTRKEQQNFKPYDLELFYAHIVNMNSGSFHTRSFRRYHLSVFKYRLTKNGFAGSKSFRGFKKTDLRFLTHFVSRRGDYRSGKRLNMRKVIPYIASQFRKDKIWLRRTKPSKRQYQIMLAVDDSSSMNDNHSKQVRGRNK